MRIVGLGYRRALSDWLRSAPAEVELLEITAEHFYGVRAERLTELRQRYPLLVHGLGLSLGTPGPLDPADVAAFKRVVDAADPLWISEHVAFTRTTHVDLGHLNPISYNSRSLATVAEHADEIQQRCGRQLLLENISTHLVPPSDIDEADFMGRLCRQTGCGLLLDVTNLFVNATNQGFDPLAWVNQIDPQHIVQLHAVGYSRTATGLEDHHAEPIQEDLMAFTQAVLDYATELKAVIIERDLNFPAPESLQAEMWRLKHGE